MPSLLDQLEYISSLVPRIQLPHSRLGYHISRIGPHIFQGRDLLLSLTLSGSNFLHGAQNPRGLLILAALGFCSLLLLWYHVRAPTASSSFDTGHAAYAAGDTPDGPADSAITSPTIQPRHPHTHPSACAVHLHSAKKAPMLFNSPQESPNTTLISSVKLTDYTPMTQALAQLIYPVGSVWPRIYYVAFEEATRRYKEGRDGRMELDRRAVLSDLRNGRVVPRWTSLSAEQTVGLEWEGIRWLVDK
ncbi:hypothetical protein IAR50_000492 [Cryptococcus sp. DSM 104548]